MRRRRWSISIVTGLGVLLALGAAFVFRGGREELSKAEYERKVRTVYADVQRAFQATDVRAGLLAQRVAAAQEELRKAADALAEAAAPKDVRALNAELVAGLYGYADDLDELREAAERRDTASIRAFNEKIPQNEAVERMAEAAVAMLFRGYDIGPIAEE